MIKFHLKVRLVLSQCSNINNKPNLEVPLQHGMKARQFSKSAMPTKREPNLQHQIHIAVNKQK